MANDETPLTNERTGSPSVALLPTNVTEHHNGEWSSAALAQPAEPSGPTGPDLTAYLHAFRRHWLMGVGIGLLCAAIVGPAVWFLIGARYTASSYLRVAMQDNSIAFQDDSQWMGTVSTSTRIRSSN